VFDDIYDKITFTLGEERFILHPRASDASRVEFRTHNACMSFEVKFVGRLQDSTFSSE